MLRELGEDFAGSAAHVAAACLCVAALAAFLLCGAVLAWVDARTHRLPNRWVLALTLGVIPPLLIAAVLKDDLGGLWRTLGAAAAAGVLFFLLYLVSPRSLGFGDVKLVPALGALLGYLSWGHVLLAGVIACLVAGIHAAVVMLRNKDRKAHIAFGPALLSGTALALLL